MYSPTLKIMQETIRSPFLTGFAGFPTYLSRSPIPSLIMDFFLDAPSSGALVFSREYHEYVFHPFPKRDFDLLCIHVGFQRGWEIPPHQELAEEKPCCSCQAYWALGAHGHLFELRCAEPVPVRKGLKNSVAALLLKYMIENCFLIFIILYIQD